MEDNANLKKLRIPSWVEIAVSLGRIPRFGGRTTAVWTDLHHSLVVEAIGAAMVAGSPKKYRDNMSCYMLLHDAHEFWTGDIPTPFKTDEICLMQRQMDLQIREHYRIPEPPFHFSELVHTADKRAYAAESVLVRPERFHYFVENSGRLPVPEPQDLEIVRFFLNNYGTPHYTMYADSPAVEAFVRLAEAGVRSFKK